MQTDELRKHYESETKELLEREDQHFALGLFLEIIEKANLEYSALVIRIGQYEEYISNATDDFTKSSHKRSLESLLEKMNTGKISISHSQTIPVNWWLSGGDKGYYSTALRQTNPNWEESIATYNRRNAFLMQLCINNGVGCRIEPPEEVYYFGTDSKDVKIVSGFDVPISMIKNPQQLAVKQFQK